MFRPADRKMARKAEGVAETLEQVVNKLENYLVETDRRLRSNSLPPSTDVESASPESLLDGESPTDAKRDTASILKSRSLQRMEEGFTEGFQDPPAPPPPRPHKPNSMNQYYVVLDYVDEVQSTSNSRKNSTASRKISVHRKISSLY